MAWRSDLVVLIATDEGRRIEGTGFVVAPNRVLTARHVLEDEAGRMKAPLFVRRDGARGFVKIDARPHLPADSLDVAVLEAPLEGTEGIRPMSLLSARHVRTGERWEARGFAKVRDKRPSATDSGVEGTAVSWDGKPSKLLELNASVPPDDWRGLSGSAVVMGDPVAKVVGVVRALHDGWDNKRIDATPVGAFLHHKWFRDALGLGRELERMDALLVRVEKGITSLLHKHPRVAEELFRACERPVDADTSPAAMASWLIHECRAGDMARYLNHADSEVATNGGSTTDRRALVDILCHVLPIAIDWWQTVLNVWSAPPEGARCVDLSLRTETAAEIVMSGVDERFCAFDPKATGLSGAALVRVPAAARGIYIDPTGRRFMDAVVRVLAKRFSLGTGTYESLRPKVEGELRARGPDAPPRDRLPYYLLFEEEPPEPADGSKKLGSARIRGKAPAPLPNVDAWAVAREVAGKQLKSLRLVRLVGGGSTEADDDEGALVAHVRQVFSRTLQETHGKPVSKRHRR